MRKFAAINNESIKCIRLIYPDPMGLRCPFCVDDHIFRRHFSSIPIDFCSVKTLRRNIPSGKVIRIGFKISRIIRHKFFVLCKGFIVRGCLTLHDFVAVFEVKLIAVP